MNGQWIIKRRTVRLLAGLFFGLIFGFFQISGKAILEETRWNFSTGIQFFVEFIVIVLVSGSIAALGFELFAYIVEKFKVKVSEKKISFFTVYTVLLICYIPCFIAYFPGCMSYDSWYITLQALGIIGYDNHHPFLHTFIWSIYANMDEWLGVRQIGIALYTTSQLLVMLAIYTYAYVWLSGRKVSGVCRKIAFFYYAFNPVFHIFTLILTKDVLFSGLFLLLCITFVDYFESIRKKKSVKELQVRLAVISLLCCLFRNNMIYVLIVMTVILFLKFRPRLSDCRGLLISVILYYFIICVIYPGIGVAQGSVKEMMSVPLSQIAAVYQSEKDTISEEDKELIFKYIPDVEQYDRFFADPVKAAFNDHAFRESKLEFIGLWCRLFWKHPGIYVRAFLTLNLPYWYPEMDSVREYIETDNYSQDYPVQRAEVLPRVYDWYENISENEAAWMHWPVFRQLYAIGMPVWILLFFGIWFYTNKRSLAGTAMLLCVVLWMTYLPGPVSCFRYIEPLLLTYPLWFILSVERENAE